MVLAGCGAPPRAGVQPPTDDPLTAAVEGVWGRTTYASIVLGREVTWRIGQPPNRYDGCTTWWTPLGFACHFDIVLDRVDDWLIGHEEGHVVCVKMWGDPTEACAESMRVAALPGS